MLLGVRVFNGRTCVCGFGHYAYPCEKQVAPEVNMLVKTRTPSRSLGRARTVHEPNHTSTTSAGTIYGKGCTLGHLADTIFIIIVSIDGTI